MIGHRVDRKISACEILNQRAREGDRRRMTMIFISAVGAISSDFQIHAAAVQGLRAVLEAGLDQRPAAESGGDLFGPRGRGDIIIVRHHAAQAVSHAAADQISRVTVLIERFDRLPRGGRHCHGKHPYSSLCWIRIVYTTAPSTASLNQPQA